MKISLIGAGSLSFGIGTLKDIYLNNKLCNENLEVSLMDIDKENLEEVFTFSKKLFTKTNVRVRKTADLYETLANADYVIVAIEVDRYKYWSQDFHVPRLFGSTQAYGENGGPGSMFHTLRNLEPILEIAYAMEMYCPEAWLINYTNPEAKLIQALNHFTNIRCVGLCHGFDMGIAQIAEILKLNPSKIEAEGGGLNHFGWFITLKHKETQEDLYPLLKEKLQNLGFLHEYDHLYLSRLMLDLYGYFPYPGTNHIGEYVRYGQDYYLGNQTQFNYNPMRETLDSDIDFEERFIYSIDKYSFDDKEKVDPYEINDLSNIQISGEVGIPLVEALYYGTELKINAVNMANNGAFKFITDESVIETQAIVKNSEIRFIPYELELPTAVVSFTQLQCNIHKLLIEAYEEKSRDKLLQAIMLDPQAPSLNQAVAMIDLIFEMQSELLPKLKWSNR